MKRFLLSLCICAIGFSSFGAMVVDRHGNKKSTAARKELNVKMRGKVAHDLKSRRATKSQEVISTPPAGEKRMMLGSSMTFYVYYDEIAQDESYGTAYESVFCDDGSVYLKNPVSMFEWDTYIKGEVTDEGLEFSFPQPICTLIGDVDGEEEIVDLMVDVLEYTIIENPDNPLDYTITFTPAKDTRTIKFLKEEDGSYMMDGEYMMGLTWNDIWQGYGEMSLRLEPLEATPITVPQGLDYDYSYILADELNGWDHTVLRPLGIAFDGDDVYIKGAASGMPDAVIKGSFDREQNKLYIPSNQFLGIYYNHYIFMMTGEGYEYYDEDWEEDMITFDIMEDPVVLNFDPTEKLFTPEIPEGYEYVYLIFNFGNTIAYPCEYYTIDRIYNQGEITDYAPIVPEFISVNDISEFDPDYSYSFDFMIYGDNDEGQILRDDAIFYNIFINGELYTFTSEEYPELEDEGYESLTEIPVFLNVGSDIFSSGNYHGIALKVKGIETIGVRAVYDDGIHRAESKIITVDTEGNPVGAVEEAEFDSYPVNTQYYDIHGRRVTGMQPNEITILRSVNADGTVTIKKVIGR